jgi:kinetochore protein Nuf2
LQDIYKPDSARLRRHLSAIVNFAKFREEKLVAYTEMQQRIDQLLEEQRVLQETQAQHVSKCQHSTMP